MNILAFMQNMWVRNPERVKRAIERTPVEDRERFRSLLIERFLFAGCLTGRRLKATFGEELCDRIIWDEASPEIAGDPKTVCPPCEKHILAVIARHKPDVIITFGKVAGTAVYSVWKGRIVCAPHPAARQPDIIQKLKQARADLDAACVPLAL